MDQQTARGVLNKLDDVFQKFNEIALMVQPHVDEPEFKAFWSSVCKVFGEIDDSIMNPIFTHYPELAPPEDPQSDPSETNNSRDRMFNEFVRDSPAWAPLISEIGELEVKRRYLGYTK